MDVYNVEDKWGDAGVGTISYDPDAKSYSTTLPLSQKKKQALDLYFGNARTFIIPKGEGIDDYALVEAIPLSDAGYFRMAMSMLYPVSGLWVSW